MEQVELKIEDRNAIKNLIILYNEQIRDSQKAQLISNIIKSQIDVFNDGLYEKYNIDKSKKIKLSQNYETFEVIEEKK